MTDTRAAASLRRAPRPRRADATPIPAAEWRAGLDRVVTAPDDRRNAVLNVMRGARRQLTLSLFRCTDDAVLAELAHAVDRGVQVDVLVTARSKGKKKLRRLWEALDATGAGIHAYTDPVVKYHAKYLIADDGPAIVASLNFTRKCFRRTLDALVITHDPAVVDGLRRLHAADCEGHPVASDLPDRLIIGPERARRQFTALIEGARSSVRLIDPKLSDLVLTKLLEARRQEGIAVDVYRAKRLNGLQAHGKLLLVDNSLAVVGSLALAALSLDFRREVALTVLEPTAVADIARLFDAVAAAEKKKAEKKQKKKAKKERKENKRKERERKEQERHDKKEKASKEKARKEKERNEKEARDAGSRSGC